MRVFRLPLLLLTVFGVLVFVAYYEESATIKEKEEKKKAKAFFSHLEPTKATLYNKKEKWDLVLKGDKWHLVSPIKDAADDKAVKELIEGVLKSSYSRVVSSDKEDWQKYGLLEPLYSLALTDGKEERVLYLGANAPVGYHRYARVLGDDRSFLASEALAVMLNKDLYALRSKFVLSKGVALMDKFSYQSYGQEKIHFVRDEAAKWQLKGAENTAVDQDDFVDFTQMVGSIRALEVLDAPKASLAKVFSREDEKSVDLAFTDKKGESYKLSFRVFEEGLYASYEGENKVYKVGLTHLEKLQKKRMDFRYRNVLTFDSTKVTKLFVDQKEYVKKNIDWFLKGESKENDRARELLVDLEFAKADMILVKKPGSSADLTKALLKVSMFGPAFDEKKGIDLTFFPDTNKAYHWVKRSSDGLYFRVKSQIVNSFHRKPEAPVEPHGHDHHNHSHSHLKEDADTRPL